MLHRVYIAFGSNLGNREQNIRRALSLLVEEGLRPVKVSSLTETAPVGFSSSHLFLNGAALLETTLPLPEVLEATERVERRLGRTHKSSGGVYGDRTVDIDILYYDSDIIATERLTVPHPRISERLFVLSPLSEIAPDFRDPVSGFTIETMLRRLKGED